jgi:hypothetical protein
MIGTFFKFTGYFRRNTTMVGIINESLNMLHDDDNDSFYQARAAPRQSQWSESPAANGGCFSMRRCAATPLRIGPSDLTLWRSECLCFGFFLYGCFWFRNFRVFLSVIRFLQSKVAQHIARLQHSPCLEDTA